MEGLILFLGIIINICIICSVYIRIGNCVLELRKINKQLEQFLKNLEIK